MILKVWERLPSSYKLETLIFSRTSTNLRTMFIALNHSFMLRFGRAIGILFCTGLFLGAVGLLQTLTHPKFWEFIIRYLLSLNNKEQFRIIYPNHHEMFRGKITISTHHWLLILYQIVYTIRIIVQFKINSYLRIYEKLCICFCFLFLQFIQVDYFQVYSPIFFNHYILN